MATDLQHVIEQINLANDPVERNLPSPSDALIHRYEKVTGFTFPEDHKIFLKAVSNAFIVYMSPFTLNESMKEDFGDLRVGINEAREIGVPESWLPICEDNGDYYCLLPDGKVRFWDHNGSSDEAWPDLATWAKEVWLGGG